MTVSGKVILYITLDGLTDPLGRSQVLPYLIGLSGRGHHITILSCEKPGRLARDSERVRRICDQAGISWHPIRYRTRPPLVSSLLNAHMLKRAAVGLHRTARFDIVHCRSYIPALAGMELKRRFGVRFLFDMRGFWPDERVEGNLWPQSNPVFRCIYRHVKKLELQLLGSADHIISLTAAGKKELEARPVMKLAGAGITVIPCCVDFDHFALPAAEDRARARTELGIGREAKVVAYLGSVGTWYLLDEMLDFFAVYAKRYPGSSLLFVTQDDPGAIRAAAAARGIGPERLIIRPASREEVPTLMSAADLGLFFIKPVFSKKASSPTKMGEMLALGLPVVTNAGVGDVEEIVEAIECGAAITGFGRDQYERAIDSVEAIQLSPQEIRQRAHPWFDIELGIERYDAVYRLLSAD